MEDQTISVYHTPEGMFTERANRLQGETTKKAAEILKDVCGISAEVVYSEMGWQLYLDLSAGIMTGTLIVGSGALDPIWGATVTDAEGDPTINFNSDIPELSTDPEAIATFVRRCLDELVSSLRKRTPEQATAAGLHEVADMPGENTYAEAMHPADLQDPAYLAYCAAEETRYERAQNRRREDAPHAWGDRLDEGHYFCLPCWLDGDETGAHSDDHPPCELEPRGPFDPR